MKAMLPAMSLRSKGAMLVAIPLACQIVFVACLMTLLVSELENTTRVAGSRAIVAQTHIVGNEVAKRMTTLIGGEMFGEEASRPEFGHITAEIDKLNTLVGNDENHLKDVARLYRLCNEATAYLNQYKQVEDRRTADAATARQEIRTIKDRKNKAVKTAFNESVELGLTCRSIIDREKLKMLEVRKFIEQRREQVGVCLNIALVLNVGLAVFLPLFYALSIKNRLSSLSENARRISSRRELLPLHGADEFGKLNQLFFAVDREITLALQREASVVETAADLICSIDQNGTFQKVNAYSTKLLGFSKEELTGKSVLDLAHTDDCARLDEEIATACNSDWRRSFEVRLKRKNGDIIDTQWSCIWSARFGMSFCIVHDITERKAVERLKDDFVAMVSHDLRGPLTSILGTLYLLKEGTRGPLAEPVLKDLTSAENSVGRLISLVNDLLDFEKLRAGKMEFNCGECSIKGILENSISSLSGLAEKYGVALVLKESDSSVPNRENLTAYCDADKVERVVGNLLSNAIKFSPEGGTVTIMVAGRDGWLEVAVIDEGPGVPSAFHQKIFDAFGQVSPDMVPGKEELESSGLGLAICKMIVDGHGGQIGVKDNESAGSTFWFLVPSHESTRPG